MAVKDEERQATVRFPAPLYDELAEVARREHRSVSAQIIVYAEQGVRGRQQAQQQQEGMAA
jgi:hypothetical protein